MEPCLVTGYYPQLQEWNISQELDEDFDLQGIDVTPCSRYVVVLLDRHVLSKDVENDGETIQSLLLHGTEGRQVFFTRDGH